MREFRAAEQLLVKELVHGTIEASYAGFHPPRAEAYFKTYDSDARNRFSRLAAELGRWSVVDFALSASREVRMKIVDLTEDKKGLFCLCLEDWSEEAKEAGPKRRQWLDRCEKQGLRAKLAVDDDGVEGGMIQYGPIEHSFVDGSGLFFIYCIHVHGHKQGRGNFRKQGMGRALLEAAEQDARALGALGMSAWGTALPFWMKASWFKKRGYRKADRQGMSVLLWKPFVDDAQPPRWFPKVNRQPEATPGRVTVTAFTSGWCLAQNLVYERAKRAAAEFGEQVVFHEIDTSERSTVVQWGMSDAVLVDGKNLQKGPPPSYEKIHKTIARRVRRHARRG